MKKILVLFTVIIAVMITSVSAFALDTEAEEIGVDALYTWFCENAGNVLSLLSLIGTLFLAVTYKRGLLPKFSTALNRVSDGVKEMKASSESASESFSKALEATTLICERIEKNYTELAESVDALTDRLESCEDLKREREKMKTIMLTQIEMLYAIFTSSSLPQYAKEEVGIKIADMRAALEAGEGNE